MYQKSRIHTNGEHRPIASDDVLESTKKDKTMRKMVSEAIEEVAWDGRLLRLEVARQTQFCQETKRP